MRGVESSHCGKGMGLPEVDRPKLICQTGSALELTGIQHVVYSSYVSNL